MKLIFTTLIALIPTAIIAIILIVLTVSLITESYTVSQVMDTPRDLLIAASMTLVSMMSLAVCFLMPAYLFLKIQQWLS